MSRLLLRARPAWPLPALAVLTVAVIVAQGSSTAVDDHLIQLAQTAIPVAFAAVSVHRAIRERSVMWSMISVYAIGCAVGQLGWTASGVVSGPTQHLMVWDLVYLVGMPVGLVSLVWLGLAGVPRGRRLRVLLDAAVAGSSMAVILWVFGFAAASTAGRLPTVYGSLAFPVIDLAATAIIMVSAIYQPRRWPLRWLAAASLAAAMADSISLVRPAGAPPTDALRILWIAGPLLILAMACAPDDPTGRFEVTSVRRTWLYYVVAIAAVSAGWSQLRDGYLDAPTVWFGIALVISICAQQAVQFREVRDLVAAADSASRAFRESEERFRNAFEGAPVGIAVLHDRVVQSVNPALIDLLGLSAADIVGLNARAIISPDAVPDAGPEDWAAISGEVEGFDHEFQWTKSDGTEVWLHITVARPRGHELRTIAILQDVSDRRAAHDRLAALAVSDPLTGLANRTTFVERLTADLELGRQPAVVFIDLDRFKVVNDGLGHAAGDRVLRAVAVRLSAAVDESDLVARFAGDEFTLLIADGNQANLARVLDRISTSLHQPVFLAPDVVTHPTASIGVSVARAGIDANALLARADAAMYRAKAAGRNRAEFDGDTVDTGPTDELQVVAQLHRGLDEDEFVLHYQPVVQLETGLTVGYEALVRWQHPTRGLLMPGEFIGLAEASGLITPLGEHVLRAALGRLAQWHDRWPGRHLTMSVNVAAPQLGPEFADALQDTLARTGVDPDQVWLELTETTLMTETSQAQPVLDRLRDMGVHLTIDDFGTGYSSLSYLHRFPVEGLKIDRAFVAGLGNATQDSAICQAVVSLAKAMDLKVVAEGIETHRQLQQLKAMGCAYGQGWFFGKPQPAEAIEAATALVAEPAVRDGS